MLIDFQMRVAKVGSIQESSGWAYGSFVGVPKQAKGVPEPSLATRRWVSEFPQAYRSLSKDLARQALLGFVNLGEGDTQQAIDYLREYGLFQDGDCLSIKAHPPEIRAYWKKASASGHVPFATDLSEFWRSHKRIKAFLTLAGVVGKPNDAAVKQACREINPSFEKLKNRFDWPQIGRLFLAAGVSRGLASVPLGVSEKNGKMVAVLTSTDLWSALYVELLSYITRGVRMRQCGNKDCPKVFEVTRPHKRHCSERCQNLMKVRAWRRDQRREAARPAKGVKSSRRHLRPGNSTRRRRISSSTRRTDATRTR